MYVYFIYKLTIQKNSLNSHTKQNKVVVYRMMLLFIYMCHFKYTIKMKENQQDRISLV